MAGKATAPTGLNFGNLAFYVGGFTLSEGDYILFFETRLHQPKNQQGVNLGPEKMGVMLLAHNMADPTEVKEQFYSMGTKAHLSFAPTVDHKGILPVPGGPSTNGSQGTNWTLLLKSLYDCGLPEGVFMGDLSTIDGVHVHMKPVPEPEERKGFAQNSTGEAGQTSTRAPGSGMVAIVTEIKDDGKPWENTGGLPETTPAKKANGAVAKPVAVAKPAAKAKAAPVVEAAPDVETVAGSAISDFLSPLNGAPTKRLKLRNGVFKIVKDKYDDDMASAVLSEVMDNADLLAKLLSDSAGYEIQGDNVLVG